MPHSLKFRPILFLLATIALALSLSACGPRQPATVAEYEENHPYSILAETSTKIDLSGVDTSNAAEFEKAPRTITRTYVDAIPSITGKGSYSTRKRTDTLTSDASGTVIDFKREEGF